MRKGEYTRSGCHVPLQHTDDENMRTGGYRVPPRTELERGFCLYPRDDEVSTPIQECGINWINALFGREPEFRPSRTTKQKPN